MKKIRSSSLLIGKVIVQELKDIIEVFPIVAPLNTQGNFAVYKRNSLSVENTKDIFNYEENSIYDIVIVTPNYEDGLRLATNAKMYLERLQGHYKTSKEEEIIIGDVAMIDASEDWNNESYLQKLTFQFKLYNEPDY